MLTLTTDLGYRDPYLAIVKASLLIKNQALQVIDLSCQIKNNNLSEAAFILKHALPHFPDNTIHLVAVKFLQDRSSLNKAQGIDNSRFLLTRYKNQYILCPDNGLFTLIDTHFNETVYQLYYDENKQHFFLKDVFVDAAIHLLAGKPLQDIAVETEDYYKAAQFESYLSGAVLRGKAIYIDDFGNIITNISRSKFEELVGKKAFTITLPGVRLTKIHSTYDDVKPGAPLVLFNSFDHLEVAMNGASAYKMLCKKDAASGIDFTILIEIHD